jgi:predicted dehydrogenase
VTTRVALVGAGGHGRWHRRAIDGLAAAGVVELVALADVAPVPDAPPGVPVFTGHEELLRSVRPDVVVVCTPPHTHLPIASAALRAGADVLLEKPPVLDRAEHRRLQATVVATGRACQVGFQALASPALTLVAGRVGPPERIAAVAAWKRDDSYFRRAPWVGRHRVDGRPVLDGALANPFAHAVMQVLALAGRAPVAVEVERYRANDIEVDDTSALRLTFPGGGRAVVAVTLCAEEFVPGEIAVAGAGGTAVLEYPTDRVRLPGPAAWREVPGRPSLLANLVAHRADRAVALIAPLERTAAFTAVLESVVAAPVAAVAARWVRVATDLPYTRRVVAGVNATLREAARRLALFSELGPDWIGQGGSP